MPNTTEKTRPPRLAKLLLSLLLGANRDNEAESGIDELFRIREANNGKWAANCWYWRQVLGFVFRWRSVRNGAGTRISQNMPSGYSSGQSMEMPNWISLSLERKEWTALIRLT